MNYKQAGEQLRRHQAEIAALRDKIRTLQAEREPEPVENYEFRTVDGAVTMADLFGDRDTLFIVHNMGRSCVYCTLWADGLNGVIDHLEDAAAFVVSSPDEPEDQQAFAESRGWGLRMVSHAGNTFAGDMGYLRDGGPFPGISCFRKQDGRIMRVGDTEFGPGDDYCVIWHLLDLVPDRAEWSPKYAYN